MRSDWLTFVSFGACAALVLMLLVVILRLRELRRKHQRILGAFDAASSQLEQLQTSFHQFVPRMVVEDIINRGFSARGESREATILFADLMGFTALSEKLEPQKVVKILNGYMRAMTRAISSHNGHVSKFLGDGIMALFGIPEPNPWQAMDAARAALAMRDALREYNRALEAEGAAPLLMSVGIHSGPVVAGVIGSDELVEYTAIGDTVNTASRIEGLNRRHQTDVLISRTVAEKLDQRFALRELPAVEVKGKSEPMVTFQVVEFQS